MRPHSIFASVHAIRSPIADESIMPDRQSNNIILCTATNMTKGCVSESSDTKAMILR